MDYRDIAKHRDSQHTIEVSKGDPQGQAVVGDTEQVAQAPVLENGMPKHNRAIAEDEKEVKSHNIGKQGFRQAGDAAATFSPET